MGELVKSGRGLPDDADLLRGNVRALSHGFPGKVSGQGIIGAALHHSAALASPVRHVGPDKTFFPGRYPLMREQTAHD